MLKYHSLILKSVFSSKNREEIIDQDIYFLFVVLEQGEACDPEKPKSSFCIPLLIKFYSNTALPFSTFSVDAFFALQQSWILAA